MNWWRRLGQSRWLDACVAALALLNVVGIAQMLPGRARAWDFNFFYVSSRLLLNGDNPYTTTLGPLSTHYGFAYDEHFLPVTPYPPGFLWFFAPLAMLPPHVAFVAWVGAEVASLAAILWLVRHLLRGRLSVRGWRLVCLGVLASGTVYWHFNMSQLELPLAAIVLAGYALNRAGKTTAGCLMVTVAGLIKLYPFILLPWFLWRSADDNRGRLKNAVIAIVFVVVAVLLTGVGLWNDYVVHGLPMAIGSELGRTYHYSVAMLMINLGHAAHGFSQPVAATRLVWTLGTLSGLALIGLAYWWSYRYAGDREAEWCLIVTAMLLGIVNALGHYFIYLIFPVTVTAVRLARNPTLGRAVFYGMLLVMLNDLDTRATPFLNRHLYLKIFANDVPLLGVIGLAAFFGRELWVSCRLGTDRASNGVLDRHVFTR